MLRRGGRGVHTGWRRGGGVLRGIFFFSSRRRHTRFDCDWSSDVCSSDLVVRYTACSALYATPPLGTGTPNPESSSFAWYSWMSTVRSASSVSSPLSPSRSEERRVGKECRSRWSPYH